MPEAPERQGWDKIPVTFEDGPYAGAPHSIAYVKQAPAMKLPGSS